MTHKGVYLRPYNNGFSPNLFFSGYPLEEVAYKSVIKTEWCKAKATITVEECDTLIFPEGLARYPDES